MRTIKTYSNRAPFYNAFIRRQDSIGIGFLRSTKSKPGIMVARGLSDSELSDFPGICRRDLLHHGGWERTATNLPPRFTNTYIHPHVFPAGIFPFELPSDHCRVTAGPEVETDGRGGTTTNLLGRTEGGDAGMQLAEGHPAGSSRR